jgi:quercetin dioxygenase-like cupin family protein
MNVFEIATAAAEAVSPGPERPATKMIHDSPDGRLVVFRLEPGQRVEPHTNSSTVVLAVASGSGVVLGADGERSVRPGHVVTYAPHELHAMRALSHPLVLLAIIAPRPTGA